MIGLGTTINIGLIIAGSLCGLAFGRFMKENLKQTLMIVSGIIVLLLGMSGAMKYRAAIDDYQHGRRRRDWRNYRS